MSRPRITSLSAAYARSAKVDVSSSGATAIRVATAAVRLRGGKLVIGRDTPIQALRLIHVSYNTVYHELASDPRRSLFWWDRRRRRGMTGSPDAFSQVRSIARRRIGRKTKRASATTTKFMSVVTRNTICQLPVASLIRFATGVRNAEAPFAV